MRYALSRVDVPLEDEVLVADRGGEDFAHPVGDDLELGGCWNMGEIFHPPSRDVRYQDILAKMKFRLVQNHPAA